jgi:hypothetical protein
VGSVRTNRAGGQPHHPGSQTRPAALRAPRSVSFAHVAHILEAGGGTQRNPVAGENQHKPRSGTTTASIGAIRAICRPNGSPAGVEQYGLPWFALVRVVHDPFRRRRYFYCLWFELVVHSGYQLPSDQASGLLLKSPRVLHPEGVGHDAVGQFSLVHVDRPGNGPPQCGRVQDAVAGDLHHPWQRDVA